ncbi:MAG: SMI1/KNR4 family protein [Candidatus Pristimantibacillus sp.]
MKLIGAGDAGLNGGNILTIAAPEHREYFDGDLLYIHRLNKAEEWWVGRFPHRMDLFMPDSDELYFFDTSTRDKQGEFPIMCYDLMNDLIDLYASTFAEFLERLIDERS